ncbi:MAG TPA: aldo/keto reductase [Spirochaetia bacterium]|nr:aldo/keto reductase [Spirochaetia bacterium]
MKTTKGLRALGKSGIFVTPIGFGAMELSGGGGGIGRMFPVIAQEAKTAIIKASLDGGVNWIDTAEIYGAGVSERSVATALKELGVSSGEVVIATKWFPIFRTARSIPRTIDARRRFLDGYPIDLYMVHNPYGFSSVEEEMDAMAALAEQGMIRSVGVSNFSALAMRRAHARLSAHGLPLAVNQVNFSLLHRAIETNGVLETAKELGVTIVAYTPLASGLLTGKYHERPELVDAKGGFRRRQIRRRLEPTRVLLRLMAEIARGHDATVAQVALSWTVNFHGESIVAIPGASKESQAAESAAAMGLRLSGEEMERLDELTREYR